MWVRYSQRHWKQWNNVEKSVLLYESLFGAENNISVATCGSSISLLQAELINKYTEVDEIIIAHDKEFQVIGDTEFKKNVAFLKRTGSRLKGASAVSALFDKFNKLEYKDAPIDKGKEVFEFLYKNRIFL